MRIEVSQLPPFEYSLNSRRNYWQRYKAGKVYQERETVRITSYWGTSGRWRVTFVIHASVL